MNPQDEPRTSSSEIDDTAECPDCREETLDCSCSPGEG